MYYGNLGILLNETREEKKLSLEEVSRGCNISKAYIQLIEEGNLYQLPSYTHARSFVRKYSEYLNFNYKKDIEYLFDSECQRNIFDNKNIINNSTGTTHTVTSKISKTEPAKKLKRKSGDSTNTSNDDTHTTDDTHNTNNNSENVLSYINFKDMPDVSYDHAPPNSKKNNLLLYIVFSGISILTVVVVGLAIWNKTTSNIDPVFITPDPVVAPDITPDIVPQGTPIPYNYLATSSLGLTPTLNTYYIALITSDITNESMNQFRSLPIDDDTAAPPNVTYADAIPDNTLSLDDPNKVRTAYIEFTGESWVHIESDTGEIIEVTGESGITLPFEFKSYFTITIGNIGGASIRYDGERITSLGNEGEILRNKIFTLNRNTGKFDITTKPRESNNIN